MDLSTDTLTVFVRVAERLSVTAAAQDLGVAKSVVSKRLAQLEQALGAPLLARSTRRISLTPAGLLYLEHARRLLADAAAAAEAVRGLRTTLSGVIRVTAPVSWGHRVVGRLLPEFLAMHPGLEIDLLLEDRLTEIEAALAASDAANPDRPAAPFAVNQIVHKSNERLMEDMEVCAKHRVKLVITSLGARAGRRAGGPAGGRVLGRGPIGRHGAVLPDSAADRVRRGGRAASASEAGPILQQV